MNLGAFAAGLGTGAVTAQGIKLREDEATRKKEAHRVDMETKNIQLDRMRKEQPVLDKELQLRGAKADFDITEQSFKRELQDFEQGTRRLLSQTQRTEAQTASGAATANLQNQPDQLAVAREELNNKVLESTLRQTANIYRVAKMGATDSALELYNKSGLVEPGQRAKAMRFEEIDVPGRDGAPAQKAKVLSIEGEDGKLRRIPVSRLEALEQQFGATYKQVGNAIVRIGRDGKTTPIYEATEIDHIPDTGELYHKKGPQAGTRIPAAGGLNGDAAPRPGTPAAARVDERVTKGRVVIDKYFGISDLSGLDAQSQPAYNAIVARMGGLIRGGTDPEKAANTAILEQKDGRLNPDGTPKAAAPKPAAGGGKPGQLPKLW